MASVWSEMLPCAEVSVHRPETPGERAHVMFLSMGLRHLPVVDEASHVVGIITRKDLDYAAGFGPWRRNKQASQVTISWM